MSVRNIPTDDLQRELNYRLKQQQQKACKHEFFVDKVTESRGCYWIDLECGYCGFRHQLDHGPTERRRKLSINLKELWDR